MYYFCTYFDQHYLPRGLALYHSLQRHCSAFKLWVLCLDNTSYEILKNLNLPAIQPIAHEEFERNDKPLQKAKQNRSKIEYYFTCSPSLPLYILNNWHDVDLITYLDADLFFFNNPRPIFEEMEGNSIAIIAHRFPQNLRYREDAGIYNVGWISFKRDENGFECLHWWRERCIEWCYDRKENGRFADQKYLDDWPTRFKNVIVLQHKGANVALWNVSNYRLTLADKNQLMVDNEQLIFFHFHGLKQLKRWLYNPSWRDYDIKPSKVLHHDIYIHYIHALYQAARMLPTPTVQPVVSSHRKKLHIRNLKDIMTECRSTVALVRTLLTGRGILLLPPRETN